MREVYSSGLNFIGQFENLPAPSLSTIGDLCIVDGVVYIFSNSAWIRLEGCIEWGRHDFAPYIKDKTLIFDN